jgi:hypothetical protein
MKPGENGWLKEYLEFRMELLSNLARDGKTSIHPEHSLYRVLQPTGLMYGQSVNTLVHPDADTWTERDKMKALLVESLISSSLLFHDKPIRTPEELSQVTIKTLESIANFYNSIFPELATSSKTLFGRKKSPFELAEKILDKRIDLAIEQSDNFWTQFFHNSLLFLDIFIFGQWIHTNADRIVSDFFKYEREELRFSVVKIIAAAAHANADIAFEERKLFDFFLQSAGLSAEKKKEAVTLFEKGIGSVEEVNLPTNNSWLLKKFFLEAAILTMWADKNVEEQELNFLVQLCAYLGFPADELENSQMAIEGFVLAHWEELNHLQNKQEFQRVSDQFVKRLSRIVGANAGRLLSQVQQNEEMIALLEKARANELTADEKNKVRELLIQMLKVIPTFSIVTLPQKFLTFPILIKILPPNFFSATPKK